MKILIGKDIIWRGRVYHGCLQWQPKDAWVGAYIESLAPFKAYICLIPFFPVHVKALSYREVVLRGLVQIALNNHRESGAWERTAQALQLEATAYLD